MGERQLEKASCRCRCVRELDLEAEFGSVVMLGSAAFWKRGYGLRKSTVAGPGSLAGPPLKGLGWRWL